jgi:hypothetical protein
MDIDLIITASLVSLSLLILILRTNVSLGIMGLCAGYVFSDLLGDEIVSLVIKQDSIDSNFPLISAVSITLVLLPALLILYRFRRHQIGRTFQHFVPSIGFSLLATLFIFTNLPLSAENYLRDESVVFQQFEYFEVLIAAAVVGIAIVDVVLHDGEHKRKYKKRHKKEA